MPAARLKITDRGTIAVGMKADLMLFDPATIIDRSTFEQPRLRARGIHRVFVNGRPGVDRGFARERSSRRRAGAQMRFVVMAALVWCCGCNAQYPPKANADKARAIADEYEKQS